jgi:hypothetical protein
VALTRIPPAQRLVERAASRLDRSGLTRRSFMIRSAVVGSALVVAPRRFVLQPVTAYQAVTDLCGPGSSCDEGWTVFCCTINNGVNKCPEGTFPAGWWLAGGSSWCCGGARYYIDCNARCTKCGCQEGQDICDNACQNCEPHCNGNTCDRRRVCWNRFRYPQCSGDIACAGNAVCRIVTCTPPYLIPELSCTSDLRRDDDTAEHSAPCLQQASWEGGAAAIRLDGQFVNSPSVAEARGSTRADVFAPGRDGSLYWARQETPRGPWSSWTSLGSPQGGFKGSPAAVSWAPGRLDVFVRGGDDKLWQRFSVDGGATWSAWIKPLGDEGVLASSPGAASWAPGRLDIFVLGTDGQIWQRFYDNEWNRAWIPLGNPSAGIAGAPAAVSWGFGRYDLFVTGQDGRLYQRFYSGGWSPWIRPPGTEFGVLTAPVTAASWGVGQVSVFGRGTDRGLWWTTYHRGFWSGWARIGNAGDVFDNAPSASSRGCQQLDVFVPGTDDRVYRYRYAG